MSDSARRRAQSRVALPVLVSLLVKVRLSTEQAAQPDETMVERMRVRRRRWLCADLSSGCTFALLRFSLRGSTSSSRSRLRSR